MKLYLSFGGLEFQRAKVMTLVDLLIEQRVIVELKSCEEDHRSHWKQLLTYLKLLDLRVGLLINFGKPPLKDGLRRILNGNPPPR